MRACARIVAEADTRGRTRATVLRSESPLLLRRTGPLAGAALTVHLVSGAAGPLRGDDLRLDLEVGSGAWLDVRSAAASLALPGPPERPPSRLTVSATVAEDATLRWMPEPLIAAAGCHHVTSTDVRVAAGAALVWRDELVCGRDGEEPGDARTDITVRYDGGTVYRHELAVGPAAPGWCGPAVLGGGRAVGSIVLIGADPPPAAVAGDDAAIMPLVGAGFVAMAVGFDVRRVRTVLDGVARRSWGWSGDSPGASPMIDGGWR